MKVLLLKDVKNVGKRLDVIDVKSGHARNYLIPNNLAVVANKASLARKANLEKEQALNIDRNKKLAEQMAADSLEFSVKTGDKGEIFESVNKDGIKKALIAKGYQDFSVELSQSLKELGDHQVEISFPQGMKSQIKVTIKAQ
jgi:large subunit ribosomal protein L9